MTESREPTIKQWKRRSGFAKPSTLHHSCHVVLIQDDPS